MVRNTSWSGVGLGLTLTLGLAAQRPAGDVARPDPAREFFASGALLRVEVTLAPAEREQLRQQPRRYVHATVRVDGGEPWVDVGVKLKGSAGSFRKVDEGPGFTVNLGKFGGAATLHGLRRFHLNNGAQDESRLCEWLGNEIFTAAGRPAPRVSHAHVFLDGEELGLYVLRESFDEQFVLRVFGAGKGNLYDGGFCQDVDADLEKDAGDGADDRADLRRLLAICREFDAGRSTRFEQALDIDALIDFCALEAMLGHWDGYSLNCNNYRLWLGTTDGSGVFLPHGMDQLFGDSEASILRHPTGIVAQTLMEQPEWRKRYRERLRQLLPLFAPQRLEPKLQAIAARLDKELRRSAPELARAHEDATRDLIARVQARYRSLRVQVRAPEPMPLQLAVGRSAPLRDWRPAAQTDHVDLAKKGFKGVTTLTIVSRDGGDEERRGAFRTTLLLERGRYRLLAKIRCEDLEGGGAWLEVDGARSEVQNGNVNWQTISCDFEVSELQRDVELHLQYAARSGQAWFRLDSLQLERLP